MSFGRDEEDTAEDRRELDDLERALDEMNELNLICKELTEPRWIRTRI